MLDQEDKAELVEKIQSSTSRKLSSKASMLTLLKLTYKLPEALPSITYWYAVDPTNKLFLYVGDGEKRMCVPRVKSLLMDLMQELHNSPFSGYVVFHSITRIKTHR